MNQAKRLLLINELIYVIIDGFFFLCYLKTICNSGSKFRRSHLPAPIIPARRTAGGSGQAGFKVRVQAAINLDNLIKVYPKECKPARHLAGGDVYEQCRRIRAAVHVFINYPKARLPSVGQGY